jgi:thiamine-phosphate pyrophosphorylase
MATNSLSVVSNLLNSRTKNLGLPPLLYMTDERRTPNPMPEIMKLKPGSGVIFRHYLSKQKPTIAREVQTLCRKKRLLFFVGGDHELARTLDADGLHLPEYLVNCPTLAIRTWCQRPNKLITAAAHSRTSLLKCHHLGVDAALVSPIFKTKSHVETRDKKKTLGILGLIKMSNVSSVPVYALGGITNMNAIQLLNSRAIGIAGIGIFENTLQNIGTNGKKEFE